MKKNNFKIGIAKNNSQKIQEVKEINLNLKI